MRRLLRRLRNIWRRAFPPRAIRIPGKFPWVQPGPLPMGTLLTETKDYKVVADGRGRTITLFKRLPAQNLDSPHGRPPRASRGWLM